MSDSESGRDWNSWWFENFDLAMESRLIPTVGDSMGMIRAELFDEIKELRKQVAELKRELAQAREDGTVTLPRSSWKHDHAA
jgi:hypothetical protein